MTNGIATDPVQQRVNIIQTVQTPLGFFTLVLLVVEVIFGTIASLSQGLDRTYLVVGMIFLMFFLVGIVAFLTYKRRGLTGESDRINKLEEQLEEEKKKGFWLNFTFVDEQGVTIDDVSKINFSKKNHHGKYEVICNGTPPFEGNLKLTEVQPYYWIWKPPMKITPEHIIYLNIFSDDDREWVVNATPTITLRARYKPKKKQEMETGDNQ